MRSFRPERVPKPALNGILSFQKAFSRAFSESAPIELEMGAGSGEFSIERAKRSPGCQFIAIEKSRRLYQSFLKCCSKETPPDNLWFFHTNAVWFIVHFVPEWSLQRLFILYPNIYPKLRQVHLRWINRPFMPYLLSRLARGGCLELRTNHQEYYEEFKSGMREKFSFMEKSRDEILSPPAGTRFERKYMARGELCRTLVFKKN